jgi:hypothetical protein
LPLAFLRGYAPEPEVGLLDSRTRVEKTLDDGGISTEDNSAAKGIRAVATIDVRQENVFRQERIEDFRVLVPDSPVKDWDQLPRCTFLTGPRLVQ